METTSQWLQSVAKGEVPVNLMIDFETFGNNPDTCGIMSFALTEFDELDDSLRPRYELLMAVSMESNYEMGLDMASSQKWWNKAERTAAWSWYVEMDKVTLQFAQQQLCNLFSMLNEKNVDYRLWSRGDFDIRILRRLLKGMDVDIPYYVVRDARTFIRSLHMDESLCVKEADLLHSPMADCMHCISCIQRANTTLRKLNFYEDEMIVGVTDLENSSRLKKIREGGDGYGK